MKTFKAIALSSILLVAMVSGTQFAMASPGHVATFPNAPLPPKNIVIGGTMPGQVAVPTGQVAPVTGTTVTHTFDAVPLGYSGLSPNVNTCFNQAVGLSATGLVGPGDIQHVLVDLGSPRAPTVTNPIPFELVGAFMPGQGIGGPLIGFSITLGPNLPVATPIGAPGTTFFLPFAGGPNTFTPVVGPVGWYQTIGPTPGSTVSNIANAVVSTENYLGSCGCDDFNGDGVCGAGDASGTTEESYIVDKPVSGSIIPIDTTALLIAGLSSGPLMILPALGLVAAGAFGILRFVVKSN